MIPIRSLQPRRGRAAAAGVALAAAAVLGVGGCALLGNAAPWSTTSPSTTPSPAQTMADARAEAFAKSEEAVRQFNALNFDQTVEGNFLDPQFAKEQNKTLAEWKRQGLTVQEKESTIHLVKAVDYQTSPLNVSVLVCSTSNVRLLDKNGVDITRDERNQPVPDKPTQNARYNLLRSPDGGVTWQIYATSQAPLSACSSS